MNTESQLLQMHRLHITLQTRALNLSLELRTSHSIFGCSLQLQSIYVAQLIKNFNFIYSEKNLYYRLEIAV